MTIVQASCFDVKKYGHIICANINNISIVPIRRMREYSFICHVVCWTCSMSVDVNEALFSFTINVNMPYF